MQQKCHLCLQEAVLLHLMVQYVKRTSTKVSVNIVNTPVFTCVSAHGLLLLV